MQPVTNPALVGLGSKKHKTNEAGWSFPSSVVAFETPKDRTVRASDVDDRGRLRTISHGQTDIQFVTRMGRFE